MELEDSDYEYPYTNNFITGEIMNLGAFTIIKNEANWVGFCVLAAKDHVKEFVYFDGNSTDGTPELLDYLRKKYGLNIKVVRDQDPKDLQDDYVRVFDDCLKQVKSDYAFFLHPDMIMTKGPSKSLPPVAAYSCNMRSFAGDPGGDIFEFTEGRTNKWKNIMQNAFGLHYFGHYGAQNEDMYFSAMTEKEHELYDSFDKYPYEVFDSGIELFHYSDVRPYPRRLSRMVTCLKNQNPGTDTNFEYAAKNHPRVSLQENSVFGNFKLSPALEYPEVFTKHGQEIADVLGKNLDQVLWVKEPVTA